VERETPIETRQRLVAKAAEVLRENEDDYAELMTEEMGKPIGQARDEVAKCAWLCDYYAEIAAEHLQDEVIASDESARTVVAYQPLGPVLAIMPWNFPFWQVFRFAAPNLAAGNVGLLKHASNVPGCARAIEDVFEQAGFPEGAFTSLLISSDEIGAVIEDDRIAGVTLTGSDGRGRAVAETAGSQLKKTVLELGGSDPFVVLEDAPMDETVETAVQARLINNGQSCIAAKRFIVVDDVYDEFLDRFTEAMDEQTVGDPMDEDTDIGPQAREDLMEDLHEQVEETLEQGGKLELGGEPMDRDGAFYPPTVLTDVPENAPADQEELFGPVATVFRVPDEEAAIEKANDTGSGSARASGRTTSRARRARRPPVRVGAGVRQRTREVRSPTPLRRREGLGLRASFPGTGSGSSSTRRRSGFSRTPARRPGWSSNADRSRGDGGRSSETPGFRLERDTTRFCRYCVTPDL